MPRMITLRAAQTGPVNEALGCYMRGACTLIAVLLIGCTTPPTVRTDAPKVPTKVFAIKNLIVYSSLGAMGPANDAFERAFFRQLDIECRARNVLAKIAGSRTPSIPPSEVAVLRQVKGAHAAIHVSPQSGQLNVPGSIVGKFDVTLYEGAFGERIWTETFSTVAIAGSKPPHDELGAMLATQVFQRLEDLGYFRQ